MTIVSYTGPGLYPPILVDLINASWQLGIDELDAFKLKVADATTSWLDTASAPTISPTTVGVPSVTEPTITIPTSASVADVIADFDTQYNGLGTYLAGQFSAFRAAHFPNSDSNFAALETWLADALANPDQVIDTALADVIWEEDRTRILRDSTRASAEVVAFWASQGHPLPSGVETSSVAQIVQTSHQELAASSRNVANKTFELAYDRVKLVVTTIASSQQAALGACLEYIKAIAVAPDVSSRLVSTAYEAETKLMAAASTLLGARADAAKIALAATTHNATATQDADAKNQASELALIQARLEAILAEARAHATSAASLFNNMHASAGVSAGDSVSTSL